MIKVDSPQSTHQSQKVIVFSILLSQFSILICLSLSPCLSPCQKGISVNTNGNQADNSAILDIRSTSQGLLIPRMTTLQREAINSPAISLLIFNTTTNCFEAYVNGNWYSISCPPCPSPSAPTTSTNIATQTQINWNWKTVNGAKGYKWNTTNNYSTANDNGTNLSFTQAGLLCNTTYTLFIWAYNSCGNSASTILIQSTGSCQTCGGNLVVTHTAGINGAPLTKTITYGTVLTSIAGTGSKCWITQNLGASKQASSATDPTDAALGWYWQFDNKQGWDVNAGTYTPPLSSWNSSAYGSDITWLPANDPCNLLLGSGWRIPTCAEWTNADTNGGWNTYIDSYNSVLKLHAAGFLDHLNSGSLILMGVVGNYWGNEQNAAFTACNLQVLSYDSEVGHSEKPYAFNLRCIKD